MFYETINKNIKNISMENIDQKAAPPYNYIQIE